MMISSFEMVAVDKVERADVIVSFEGQEVLGGQNGHGWIAMLSVVNVFY